MARIGIDARKYFDFGIGTYIQQLMRAVQNVPSAHSFTMFLSPADMMKVRSANGVRTVESRFQKYSIGEFFSYGSYVRTQQIDLFHEPHYTLPVGLQGRSVVTIHDLIHLKFPEYFNPLERSYASFMIRHAVKNAGAIITVSKKTKEDLVERFRVSDQSIHVIYNGISSRFQKIEDAALLKQVRANFGLEKPFILYVGGLRPHKNIPVLLKAFKIVCETGNDVNLVFAGERLFDNAPLTTLAQGLGVVQGIKDLGRMDEEKLTALYNCAELVVLPSLYEGFGFSALEAVACGTPAIVSDRGSLPEIVGDGAAVFEAENPGSLAHAVIQILNDSELRAGLISRGKHRAGQFSWNEAATKTLAVYETVLS